MGQGRRVTSAESKEGEDKEGEDKKQRHKRQSRGSGVRAVMLIDVAHFGSHTHTIEYNRTLLLRAAYVRQKNKGGTGAVGESNTRRQPASKRRQQEQNQRKLPQVTQSFWYWRQQRVWRHLCRHPSAKCLRQGCDR